MVHVCVSENFPVFPSSVTRYQPQIQQVISTERFGYVILHHIRHNFKKIMKK